MPQHYKKVTEFVVCGTIAVVLVYLLFHIAPWPAAGLLTVYLGYEGWTLVNQRPNDTISEIIWALKKRSLVPFLFGGASIAMIALGWFGQDWKQAILCGAWFLLMGHFFFTPEIE